MLNYSMYELKEIKSLKDLKRSQEEITKDLFSTYKATTKANRTEIGFIIDKVLYSIKLKEIDITMVRLTTESKGGLKLKLQISKAQKLEWLASGKAKRLTTEQEFTKLVSESKYNKGEVLEKMLTEKRGMEWHKDSVRYDQAGDIDLKRDRIQVKFENASLTSAYTMQRVVSGN